MCYGDVGNFIEEFEDFTIGDSMKTLIMRDSFKYTNKTRFLEEGTNALSYIEINKTILNQKNFKLSDQLQVLKLSPVNYYSEFFEIKFDQFLFVVESLASNRTLKHFELGIRHGNLKKKIFNDKLYEKERMISTQRLSNALGKVFMNNQTLNTLII